MIEDKDVLIQALEKYGNDKQIFQLHEEMAELIIAINHYKRGRIDKKAILTEIIDVQIMLKQLLLMFNFTDLEISEQRDIKMNKLIKAINEKSH
jgi:NTP pyrophosphatase (non-canonical NTP hydrolase)